MKVLELNKVNWLAQGHNIKKTNSKVQPSTPSATLGTPIEMGSTAPQVHHHILHRTTYDGEEKYKDPHPSWGAGVLSILGTKSLLKPNKTSI